ncbi:unnamed protein product [Withania somnifera]
MKKLLMNVFLLTIFVFLGNNVEGLGVNWGDISSHKLPPKDVVKMLQENGITKVMIGISNQILKDLVNPDVSKKWVKENVTRYDPKSPKGVNITLIGVGNEPFLRDYKDTLTKVTGPALENIQNLVPLNADVYLSPSRNPVLNKNKAPFMVNIYPFLSLFYGNGSFPFDYAFFDAEAGYGNMTIMIGEMGWPTDGNPYGNVTLAEIFYKGFVSYLAKEKGSPRRHGYIETYLFSLFDEDKKSTLPGNFETHWGLYYDDGTPKFPLDLHGKKKNLPDVKNFTDIMTYVCDRAYCTPITNGSSCQNLSDADKASYAVNAYFQNQQQKDSSCNFEGKATITTKDPSQGTCNFTIGFKTLTSLAPSPSPLTSSNQMPKLLSHHLLLSQIKILFPLLLWESCFLFQYFSCR